MILVVGATGLLGGEICRQLRRRGHPVRGLVRDGSPREASLRDLGVEIVRGDLKDPASLRAACSGAGAVLTTANSIRSRRAGDSLTTVDRDGTLALVGAAHAAGVARFVYTSVDPQISSRAPFVRYKREVEVAVRRSGMGWTILQPAPFMQIHLGPTVGWDLAGGRTTIFGPGTTACCYVDVGDVARFAVVALERPEFGGAEMVIGGPEAMSPREALRVFEEVTGRTFSVRSVPLAAIRVMAAVFLPFNPIVASMMILGSEAAGRESRIDMRPLLARVPEPFALRSVRDYVAGEWAAQQNAYPRTREGAAAG